MYATICSNCNSKGKDMYPDGLCRDCHEQLVYLEGRESYINRIDYVRVTPIAKPFGPLIPATTKNAYRKKARYLGSNR